MDTISVDGSDGVKIVISDDISVSEFAEWLITSDLSGMDILASKTTADNLRRRSFPLNSKIKEILEQHNATLYLTEEPSLPTTVIDGNQAHYYVRIGNVRRFVKLSDDEIGSILTDEFESLLESASRVDIDTLFGQNFSQNSNPLSGYRPVPNLTNSLKRPNLRRWIHLMPCQWH